ncbi:MAG: hypothetical protein M3209_07825 [Acidobacteriota bacterium]|nr:hypothetical protein [Acidobacteriota bacterium]
MRKTKIIFALIFAATFASACGEGAGNQNPAQRGNSATANTNTTANVAQTPQTPLESELARLQRANFRQIIAFSRKDGGKLTDEDIEYFREWAPSEQINQRLRTDDGKYIVAGTNFVFTPEQLKALQERFAVEDFTEKYGRKPEPAPKQ